MQPIRIRMAEGAEDLLPSYAHETDAGMDLRSTIDVEIAPHDSFMVPTGVHIEIPQNHFGLQAPRSGLGSRGITMSNAVGIIDSGYRGEILCALWNTTDEPFQVHRGDRISQLVILPCAHPTIDLVDSLADSDRGEAGYGSTGIA